MKNITQKLSLFLAIILFVLFMTACGGNNSVSQSESLYEQFENIINHTAAPVVEIELTEIITKAETTTEFPTEESAEPPFTTEELEQFIFEELQGNIGSTDNIVSVVYENKTILVNIVLGDSDSFTMNDLAETRSQKVTDIILNLDIDDYWDNITLDFKDVWQVTRNKSHICDYGEPGVYKFFYFDWFGGNINDYR